MELFGVSIPLCVAVFVVCLVLEVALIIRAVFFQKRESQRNCFLLFFGGCAVACSMLWMLLYFFSSTFER